MPRRRTRMLIWILAGAAAALVVAGAWLASAFTRDMARAYARIEGRSQVLATEFGDVEYAEGGRPDGPPVLVVHGSGGGFDQGEFLARAVLDEDRRWILPSRFGYLRSTFRPGATFDDQAHAYARLLDRLGVERVAVVAFSHGGPSALLFAALHPQRVSSLTLLSAGVASSDAPEQRQADWQGRALTWIYQRDWRYWALTHAFERPFLSLMGASEAVTASLAPAQRALAAALVDAMNPVAPRAAGVSFDNRAQMPNERISAIRAPTLVVHARDDTLQRFHNAEFAVRTIPGARLAAFERGGHLLLAVEQAAIRERVTRHLRAADGPEAPVPPAPAGPSR